MKVEPDGTYKLEPLDGLIPDELDGERNVHRIRYITISGLQHIAFCERVRYFFMSRKQIFLFYNE
ncbi:MAG: hypothetical protein LBQ66_15000 [Planctomycetaceae bacterium]|nr:hypothetical protein [Planctomycetaceae bacterium]